MTGGPHVPGGGAAPPALLLVAHGSRDPRHAATVLALTSRVREAAPGTAVSCGFLDFNLPRVADVLGELRAAGHRSAVAVPLLLNRAFHATSDIPRLLAGERARRPGLTVEQSEVLGPHPLLTGLLERRLAEANGGPLAGRSDTGVVLASAGTSDPAGRAALEALAERWRRTAGWGAVVSAYASASGPDVALAVRALRAEGLRRVVVAPYVIAPGRLPDRITVGAREAGADLLAPVLGAAPELARVVVTRYRAAASRRRPALPLAG
ncbi:sirohydrochlorin chelatase [Streptomyces sp. 3MP-14]|uniref:Sirohydrochlorin chelatase n=1 Tax=Streptomyces mimosae TaxID=2586635 RepID=A0A5N6AGM1_9ACTN|nr:MULTISPECIES: sirohydrochlorin chelatase [Streptomyces]KAB8167811.1 sirohydrochlorin chelatase [Streptomyces mimosae]KAB8177541.1 sirohydrochlorin chelatase [Streptomyces sp. 3MP-14]